LVSIVLAGSTDVRALELCLDSVVGQTDTRFVLYAAVADLGAAGVALLAGYGDARLFVGTDMGDLDSDYVAVLQAGDLWAPTYLARMLGALAARPDAVVAICRFTWFDGETLERGDAGAAQSNLIFRGDVFVQVRGCLPDVAAMQQAAAPCGGVVTLPHPLAIMRRARRGNARPKSASLPTTLFGRVYTPADVEADRPPTLHVVVDTEAEFDWEQPFATDLTAVSAMAGLESAQAIFDRYGVRPVYVVDYPVASQPAGIAAIRAVADRGAGAVGAHLHPWTNPPFGEDTSRRLSFPGNLPSALEAAKLDSLLEVIGRNFSTAPPFYKAGRYGLGPNTAGLIAARGARVDFSLLPQTDLRRQDGPDFSGIYPTPYDVDGTGLLSVPMTRAHVGLLARYRGLNGWLDGKMASSLHLPGVLARTGLLERLTLTPEGVPVGPQIRLVRALLAQGQRLFVLHYHSPSLVAGHTPYVRTEADRVELLARIDGICRWFFEELGGLPGRPWDLLPRRERVRA
jgi:hypothetical protein